MCSDLATGQGSRVHTASLQSATRSTPTARAPSAIVSFEAGLQDESELLNVMSSRLPEHFDMEMGTARSESSDMCSLLPGTASAEGTGGPGGCSRQWDSTKQVIKAGVVQGMATAAVFGTKPIVEASLLTAMGVTSLAGVTPAAAMIAGVAGGVYAGAVHTLAGRVVSGVMNGVLQADTYSLRPGHSALAAEVATIDLPVMGSFVAAYAARGVIMQGNTNLWVDALSKTITSTIGGVVQGMVTDALKQAMSSVYKTNEPVTVGDSKWDLFVKTFETTLRDEFASGRSIGHDLIGKTVGSVVGMLGAGQLGGAGLDPVERGATGMTVYLGSWFAGIHAGGELGDLASRRAAPASAAARPSEVDIESQRVLTPTSSQVAAASTPTVLQPGTDLV
jgi:hypothetical protein